MRTQRGFHCISSMLGNHKNENYGPKSVSILLKKVNNRRDADLLCQKSTTRGIVHTEQIEYAVVF